MKSSIFSAVMKKKQSNPDNPLASDVEDVRATDKEIQMDEYVESVGGEVDDNARIASIAEEDYRQILVYKLSYSFKYTLYEIHRLVNNGGVQGNDPALYWDVSIDEVTAYLNAGMLRYSANDTAKDKQELIKESRIAWEFILQAAMASGNVRSMVAAQSHLDRANGLDADSINININDFSKLTDQELVDQIKKIQISNGDLGERKGIT